VIVPSVKHLPMSDAARALGIVAIRISRLPGQRDHSEGTAEVDVMIRNKIRTSKQFFAPGSDVGSLSEAVQLAGARAIMWMERHGVS